MDGYMEHLTLQNINVTPSHENLSPRD